MLCKKRLRIWKEGAFMAFDFGQLLLIIFIMMTVWPMMKKKALEHARYNFLQKLGKSPRHTLHNFDSSTGGNEYP